MDHTALAFGSDHFTVYKLSDGVFAAIAREGGAAIANAGIIDLGGRTLVYDTLMTPQAARDLRQAALELTGREPDLVINSHYHNDHIWGNQVFDPSTLIVSTSKTFKLMQTAGRDELQWANEVSAKRLQAAKEQYETARDEHARQESLLWIGYFGGLVQALPDLTVRFPEITFDKRLSIHGSSMTAELLAFENCHTGSDAILLLPDRGIVFMADLLFVQSHPYLDECDVDALRLALEEISGMGATRFVPGHGPLGAAQDLASNIEYIDMCREVAQRLVAQGDTSPERLARELPPDKFSTWSLSRFFTANIESLCSKATASQPET